MKRLNRYLTALATLATLALTVPVLAAEADLGQRLDGHLQALEDDGFTGIVLVAKDGEIVFERGYGLADREAERAVTPDTVFTIGSITKQFTGAAILKLEMAGKLSVDDSITKYFDDVPADKSAITLHHLLTHTAGFPGAIGHDFDVVGRDAFVRLALERDLEAKPGERHEYSNVGYSLLAAVVEKVSGSGYEHYMRQNLFLPAGMKDTGYVLPQWEAERLAQGYRNEKLWGSVAERLAESGISWHLQGNGGIHSTARDMFRWHLALEGDAILSAAAKEKLYKRHVSEGGDSWYGYGWSLVDTSRGTRLVTHNGGNMVFFADFLRFVDDDVVVFLASSVKSSGLGRLGSQLARMVFDPSYRPARPGEGAVRQAQGEEENPYGLPNSPTGRRSSALLAAIASGDDAARATFVRETFAPQLIEKHSVEKLVGMLGNLADEVGEFELIGAQKTGPASAELHVQPRQGGPKMILQVDLETEEPHRIVSLGVDADG